MAAEQGRARGKASAATAAATATRVQNALIDGSLCGILLAYYLTSVGDFTVLTPVAMVLFLLLWLLPTLLIAGLVRHF